MVVPYPGDDGAKERWTSAVIVYFEKTLAGRGNGGNTAGAEIAASSRARGLHTILYAILP